ncbi:hypothetical protein SBADM41S_07706 [Streptomyces badius]
METGWQGAFRSRDFFGPYEERVVLSQGRTDVNGPHQGGWVRTAAGEDWFLHFQARGAYGRVVHLQPMHWDAEGWPVIGDAGEPVSTHRKPAAPEQPVAAPAVDDDFPGGAHGKQWQWTANPCPDAWTEESGQSEDPGHVGRPADGLRLSCLRTPDAHDLRLLPNVLVQRMPAEEFTVEVDLELHSDEPGAKAGLAVLGDAFCWIGLEAGADGTSRLVHRYAEGAAESERDAAGARASPGGRARLRMRSRPGPAAASPPTRETASGPRGRSSPPPRGAGSPHSSASSPPRRPGRAPPARRCSPPSAPPTDPPAEAQNHPDTSDREEPTMTISKTRRGRTASTVSLVAALALTAAACGDDGSEAGTEGSGKGEITFWDNNGGPRTAIWTEIIKDFEKQHPDIKVKYVPIPIADVQSKYDTAIAGGGLPDVGGVGTAYLANMVSQEALEPVNKRLKGSALEGKLVDSMVESVRGEPPGATTSTPYRPPPTTACSGTAPTCSSRPAEGPRHLGQLLHRGREAHRRPEQQVRLHHPRRRRLIAQALDAIYGQSGITEFWDGDRTTLDDPKNVAALEKYAGLFKRTTPAADVNNDFTKMVAQWDTGTIGMLSHNLGSYQDHAKALGDDKFAGHPGPHRGQRHPRAGLQPRRRTRSLPVERQQDRGHGSSSSSPPPTSPTANGTRRRARSRPTPKRRRTRGSTRPSRPRWPRRH